MPVIALNLLGKTACLCLLLLAGGCNVIGFVGASMPEPTIPASYADLQDKAGGVIIWTPLQVRADNPQLTLDLGQAIQARLEYLRDKGGRGQKRMLENLTFPNSAASYVAHVSQEPRLADMPVVDYAGSIENVDRIIYVELDQFTTRAGVAGGLVRGQATFGLQVIAINHETKQATVAYRDAGLVAAFPPTGPVEGSTRLRPEQAYQGLVLEIAKDITQQFVPHKEDE